jgi:hypothetical protein
MFRLRAGGIEFVARSGIDHIWWISDVRRFQSSAREWHMLEIHDAMRQRIQSAGMVG